MAIATLDKVFANPDVFTGVVKIRKGLACKLILEASTMEEVHATFAHFIGTIVSRIDRSDPASSRTLQICNHVTSLCASKDRGGASRLALLISVILAPIAIAGSAYHLSYHARVGSGVGREGLASSTTDLAAWGLLLASTVSLLACGAISTVFAAPALASPVATTKPTSSSAGALSK